MSFLAVLRICFDYPVIFSSGLQKIVRKEEEGEEEKKDEGEEFSHTRSFTLQ